MRLLPGIEPAVKNFRPGQIDFCIVRENNEGEYSNIGGRLYSGTEDEFAVLFPDGTDVAFSDEIFDRGNEQSLIALFTNIWKRRILKKDAHGIHGIIFYGLPEKKQYYPTRKDEEAINPNGSRLR